MRLPKGALYNVRVALEDCFSNLHKERNRKAEELKLLGARQRTGTMISREMHLPQLRCRGTLQPTFFSFYIGVVKFVYISF